MFGSSIWSRVELFLHHTLINSQIVLPPRCRHYLHFWKMLPTSKCNQKCDYGRIIKYEYNIFILVQLPIVFAHNYSTECPVTITIINIPFSGVSSPLNGERERELVIRTSYASLNPYRREWPLYTCCSKYSKREYKYHHLGTSIESTTKEIGRAHV